ncbi:MAG: valine--tRNA ligase [Chlamydiae bacterium]|nr:valine--tRNA ligase [Chlamydiota bacterium]
MLSLKAAYNPQDVESKWTHFWEKEGFFKADPHLQKPPFSIVIPPPNVTGTLHMGHALVDTLQDLLIRWKRMQGFETLWVPGTDHAGIATQAIVEKNLYIQTGKRRSEFSREEFLKEVWAWKEKCEGQILNQLKRLGCSCDFSRLRFTMDPGCNRAVRKVFKKMFDEGLIYQGDYLVNWDPILQTALSDDEVEHEEKPSFLWHLRYPLTDGKHSIVIATTRPETLLGDTAVAVHPKDERYAKFIGKKLHLPLTNRQIPIIGDPFVDPAFGTGAVKVTPAHDFNDFEMSKRHDLPLLNILTPEAKINEKGGRFAGMSVAEARVAIVHELKEQGYLEKVDPYLLRVGVSYRSKAVIQPYLSKQWFVKMSAFKEKLISAVTEHRVELVPPHWKQTYLHWIENLRDWCISRQLWWGHRIPIWYGPQGEMICSEEEEPPEIKKDPSKWTQDPDVLDTWFSSALWPFSTMGWPDSTAELEKFYPTSVLITGHDILFFWVARMILMGEYVMQKIPFHETFLHGLIYGKSYWKTLPNGAISYLTYEEKTKYDLGSPLPSDVESKWEKMSKSKGNVIDPLEIISEYGTDALRIALCSSATFARQIDLDRRRFEEYKNFANKIWNGARFVLLNLEGLSTQKGLDSSLFSLEDRWIFSVLNRTIQDINTFLSEYAFDKAAMRAYEFFWNDFCAIYLEAVKPTLFGKMGTSEDKENKQKILVVLLLNAIRLLHPMTPFITEEIFSLLKGALSPLPQDLKEPYWKEAQIAISSPACTVAPYPKVIDEKAIKPQVEESFLKIYELIRTIRNIRAEMQLPPQEKVEVYLSGSSSSLEWSLSKEHQNIVLSLTPTTQLHFLEKEPAFFGASSLFGSLKLTIPMPESLKTKEKERLLKEREKLEKLKIGTEGKLANEEFKTKAPKEVVEKLERSLFETHRALEEISSKMKKLDI